MSSLPNPVDFRKGEMLLKKASQLFHAEKFKKAKPFLHQALEKFQKCDAKLREAEVYDLFGVIFEIEQNFKLALEYYQDAFQIRMKFDPPTKMGESYQNLARIGLKMQKFEYSLSNALKAYDFYEQLNVPQKIAEITYLLGQIYSSEDDLQSALFYYQIAKDTIKDTPFPALQVLICENLGQILTQLGRFKPAVDNFLVALAIEHANRNFPVILQLLVQITHIYFEMENFTEAKKFLGDFLELFPAMAKELSLKDHLKNLYFLAESYFLLHEYDQAEEKSEELIEIIEEYMASYSKNPQKSQFRQTDPSLSHLLAKALFLMARILYASLPLDQSQQNELIPNYLNEAANVAENINDSDIQVEILLFQAIIDYDMNRMQSEDRLQQAQKIAVSQDSALSLARILERYGLNYYHDKDFDKAFEFFHQALEQYTHAKHYQAVPGIHYNLACVASHLSLPEEVIKNLTVAVQSNPKFRKLAQNDDDFRGFHTHDIFKKLISDE